MMSIGAGTGLLYLLRWYWWRINAWSEVAAMASSFVIAVAFFALQRSGVDIPSHIALLIGVATTTLVWVAVTYLTQPTDRATLSAFYARVRPAGPGWRSVRTPELPPSPDSIATSLLAWVLGCTFVYAALFGAGSLLYGRTTQGIVWMVLLVVSGVGLLRIMPSMWRASEG
jgi:hypothetical protein